MVGRKPKPTALKVLAGNPGCRPLNQAEPKPDLELPPPPRTLNARARRYWRRLSPELYAAGVLTRLDSGALEALCQIYARLQEANTALAKTSLVIKTTNGNLIQNPYLGIANRCLDQLGRWYAEFGMTPSSRSRIQVVQPADDVDPFDAFMNAVVVTPEGEIESE